MSPTKDIFQVFADIVLLGNPPFYEIVLLTTNNMKLDFHPQQMQVFTTVLIFNPTNYFCESNGPK
jgi:hypothetical protein